MPDPIRISAIRPTGQTRSAVLSRGTQRVNAATLLLEASSGNLADYKLPMPNDGTYTGANVNYVYQAANGAIADGDYRADLLNGDVPEPGSFTLSIRGGTIVGVGTLYDRSSGQLAQVLEVAPPTIREVEVSIS